MLPKKILCFWLRISKKNKNCLFLEWDQSRSGPTHESLYGRLSSNGYSLGLLVIEIRIFLPAGWPSLEASLRAGEECKYPFLKRKEDSRLYSERRVNNSKNIFYMKMKNQFSEFLFVKLSSFNVNVFFCMPHCLAFFSLSLYLSFWLNQTKNKTKLFCLLFLFLFKLASSFSLLFEFFFCFCYFLHISLPTLSIWKKITHI